jgi:hypothetical protein
VLTIASTAAVAASEPPPLLVPLAARRSPRLAAREVPRKPSLLAPLDRAPPLA